MYSNKNNRQHRINYCRIIGGFMKYFDYKRLNKRRKIYFWIFLIGGFSEILLGILLKNIAMITLGFVIMVECLNLYNDQVSSDLIDNYANMVETMHSVFEANLTTVRNLIREQNTEMLNKYADTVDSIYKEEKNDSNEG